MGPNRAAWVFAAGLSWMVLRSILAQAFGWANPADIAQRGGLALLLPAMSVIASFTVPVFFFTFLMHHPFGSRNLLRWTTRLALTVSLCSFAMVLVSFVSIVIGHGNESGGISAFPLWVMITVPLFFVVSIFVFLVAFALAEKGDQKLNRAAVIAAIGTLVPVLIIVGWVIHTSAGGALPWFPEFSGSLVAKALGLGSAGTLLWFLETFAVTYER